MSKTVAEKILSIKSKSSVKAGDFVMVSVDGAMASDTTAPTAIQSFRAMGGRRIWKPGAFSLVLDHASPAPNETIASLHAMIREFAEEQSCHLYDIGDGICHHLMLDNEHVLPGDLFIGADSHTCTYGAIGAFATGVGSTDLAGVLKTGHIWLKVPESVRVELNGELRPGVTSKDAMLFILRELGPSFCTYRAIEFGGSFFRSAKLFQKIPFSNMGAELGAKVSIIENFSDENCLPDPGARYVRKLEIDLSTIPAQVALPHSPTSGCDIDKVLGKEIHLAFLGSCTNTRIEDLRIAAEILQGKHIAKGVRMLVVPASRATFLEGLKDGTIETLTAAGCTFLPSGCGPCVGTHLGVPGKKEVVISAANRNFRGRMGNPYAEVYLASPATVAVSALYGKIMNPQNI